MIKIILLGYGNVGSHLLNAFLKSDSVQVLQVYNRSAVELPRAAQNIPVIYNLEALDDADIYILSVSDDVIGEISENLPFTNRLVVHTSGAAAMDVLSKKNRRGVFYPLQTFSKNKTPDFKTIPICLEAENPEDYKRLEALASILSKQISAIDSSQRAKIHVAAVFVNNFTNYLYQIGQNLLEESNISFDLLLPLIRETAEKIETLPPEQAQTGPAKRNDRGTIEKHLNALQRESDKKLYATITELIQKHHNKNEL